MLEERPPSRLASEWVLNIQILWSSSLDRQWFICRIISTTLFYSLLFFFIGKDEVSQQPSWLHALCTVENGLHLLPPFLGCEHSGVSLLSDRHGTQTFVPASQALYQASCSSSLGSDILHSQGWWDLTGVGIWPPQTTSGSPGCLAVITHSHLVLQHLAGRGQEAGKHQFNKHRAGLVAANGAGPAHRPAANGSQN